MKTSTSAHRHLTDSVRSALATLVLLAIAVVLSGCTAVGFTIGAIVDDAAARRELAHTERIPTGTRVRVLITVLDGQRTGGAGPGHSRRAF